MRSICSKIPTGCIRKWPESEGLLSLDAGLRNWYLATLGIVRYVSREPGQLATHRQSGADVADDVPLRPSLGEIADAVSVKPAKISAGNISGAIQLPVSVGEEIDPLADGSAAVEEISPFRLAFWRASPDLVVLDSLAPGRKTSPQQLELLQKILKAIGHLPRQLSDPELIDWPVSAGAQSDLPGARALLGIFLEARHRKAPFLWALLMGDAAAKVLGTPTEKSEPGADNGVQLECGATGILTASLDDMLDRPQLKAGTWTAIRFLAE